MIKKITNLMLFLWAYGILTFVWLVYQGEITFSEIWSYLSTLGG